MDIRSTNEHLTKKNLKKIWMASLKIAVTELHRIIRIGT